MDYSGGKLHRRSSGVLSTSRGRLYSSLSDRYLSLIPNIVHPPTDPAMGRRGSASGDDDYGVQVYGD
jgi:hypothetical protein